MLFYNYLAQALEHDARHTDLLGEVIRHNPLWQELHNYWFKRCYQVVNITAQRTVSSSAINYKFTVHLLANDCPVFDEDTYHAIVTANLADYFTLHLYVGRHTDSEVLTQTQDRMRKIIRGMLLSHVSLDFMLRLRQLQRRSMIQSKLDRDKNNSLCQDLLY